MKKSIVRYRKKMYLETNLFSVTTVEKCLNLPDIICIVLFIIAMKHRPFILDVQTECLYGTFRFAMLVLFLFYFIFLRSFRSVTA